MKSFKHRALNPLLICVLLLSFGCGGSGSSSSSATPAPATTVSGSVFAGPATGSSVTVKTVAGAVVAGPVNSLSDGSFSVDIPTTALAGDLVFEASGGTFSDEATATSGVTMGSLSAHVAAVNLAAGSQVTIDPSSTIVQKMIAAGKTKAAAEASFNTAFGYTPDISVKPAFANVSSASTAAQRVAGLKAACFSQLAKDLGLLPEKQFELIQALAEDLADDALDGRKSGGAVTTASGISVPEDIGNRFATAMVSYLASSLNKSKMTPDKFGGLPFGKTALTASYQVEYLPGTLPATQGKTSFNIKLTNRSDGTAASGKSVTLKGLMHMATMSHSTPVDAVTDNGDGTYSCTAYYLMASGAGMGFWDLKVTIGSGTTAETAVFYPPVAAASASSTVRGTLKGVADSITSMGVSEKRSYYLFHDGLSASTGGYTLKLFVATKESLMSYPAVSVGTVLTGLTVTTMVLEASTDGGTTWTAATADAGTGHWSFAGLTGLSAGVSGTVYVRLNINGEQKSTDGNAAAGATGYATFTVVP